MEYVLTCTDPTCDDLTSVHNTHTEAMCALANLGAHVYPDGTGPGTGHRAAPLTFHELLDSPRWAGTWRVETWGGRYVTITLTVSSTMAHGCALCGATDLPTIGHADVCPANVAGALLAVLR